MKNFIAFLFLVITVACGGGSSSSSSTSSPGNGNPPPAVTYGTFRSLKGISTPSRNQSVTSASTNPSVNMSIAREGHKALLLNDGKVMLIGGEISDPSTGTRPSVSQIDIFDPATETFSLSPAQCQVYRGFDEVNNFGILKLPDGRVLMIGRYDNQASQPTDDAGVEIYDHSAETVTSYTGVFPDPVVIVSAMYYLGNNQVLVADAEGSLGAFEYSYILDLNTMTATRLNNSPTYSFWRSTVQLSDSSVLYIGGFALDPNTNTFGQAVTDIIRFDPATQTFSVVGHMNQYRAQAGVTLLPTGKVGIYGGVDRDSSYGDGIGRIASVEEYDPSTQTCTSVANLPSAKSYMTPLCLQNGWVLAAGGANKSGSPDDTELIHDYAQNFTGFTGNMTTARLWYSGVVLNNGLVLISGGTAGYGAVSTAEIYDTGSKLAIDYSSDQCFTNGTIQFSTNYTAGVTWTITAVDPNSVLGSINPSTGVFTPAPTVRDTNGNITSSGAGQFIIKATASDNTNLSTSVTITVYDTTN